MVELFPNISDETRKYAKFAYELALQCTTPIEAAELLDKLTNDYCSISNEENVKEFLQFYFNLKMEEPINNGNVGNIG